MNTFYCPSSGISTYGMTAGWPDQTFLLDMEAGRRWTPLHRKPARALSAAVLPLWTLSALAKSTSNMTLPLSLLRWVLFGPVPRNISFLNRLTYWIWLGWLVLGVCRRNIILSSVLRNIKFIMFWFLKTWGLSMHIKMNSFLMSGVWTCFPHFSTSGQQW